MEVAYIFNELVMKKMKPNEDIKSYCRHFKNEFLKLLITFLPAKYDPLITAIIGGSDISSITMTELENKVYNYTLRQSLRGKF